MRNNQEIFEEVLSLPDETKADLVDRLIKSLHVPLDPNIDQLWAEEAEKRIGDLERGEVKVIPGDKVLRDIKEKYGI